MTAIDDLIRELCPHCDQPQPRSQIDEHIAADHANIPPCAATFASRHTDGVLHCVFRAWHAKGRGEYGEWHASARGPVGRYVWSDTADGARPHRLPEPEEQP